MEAQSQRELNRQVVARYFDEFWTKGNADIVDTLCTEDYVLYYPLHGRHTGRVAVKKMVAEFKEAFPDICFKLMSPFPLIAEEEYVVARWIGGGKHTGPPFFDLPVGALEVANSGKEMRFSGTTIYTLKEGRIVEEMGEEAGLLALQQLGIVASKAGWE